MQIHELNNYSGNLDSNAYLAVDDGSDTGKVSVAGLLADTNAEITQLDTDLNGRIDNIIAGGTAPSASEIVDARRGADGVDYASLGTAIRTQVTDLKSDIGYIDDALDKVQKHEGNLFESDLDTDYQWNCWTSTVYKQAQSGYKCGSFDIPSGTSYISGNSYWAQNSFSAYVDDNLTKIGLVKDYQQSGDGFIWSVPDGATKVCFSFNANDTSLANALSAWGILFLAESIDIRNKSASAYPSTYIRQYYADSLNLQNGRTVGSQIAYIDGKLEDVADEIGSLGFEEKKNLIAELNEGEYVQSWNIGDSVTVSQHSGYAYGIADVEGCANVTINLVNISDSYSFFTDANRKKVATIASQRVGSSRVYTVPNGAKYLYISCNDSTLWGVYGIVVLEGIDDIVTNPVSASDYPYNTALYYADGLKLSSGLTVGEAVSDNHRVFYVEKDGSGDYTSLTDAINEAIKYMDSVVYVGSGTFDVCSELGSAYMEAVSSNPSTWGLELKNRIHVIGTAKTKIVANYTGDSSDTKTYFSVFNAGAHGFEIENLAIEASNIRYVVHDDRGSGGATPFNNKYINCSMKLTDGRYGDTCIGGGLGINGTYEIVNCYFEGGSSEQRLAYYHGNNYGGETGAKCKITVQGSYFAGVGSFHMTKYGDSTEMSTAYVSNNSFGTEPIVNSGSYAPNDNVEIVEWNNEIRS